MGYSPWGLMGYSPWGRKESDTTEVTACADKTDATTSRSSNTDNVFLLKQSVKFKKKISKLSVMGEDGGN